MDWSAAIEKNHEALKRVLAMLVAMAGLAGEKATLPRHLHRAVLALLRPAEAAARRLVIVAARGLVVPPPAPPRLVKPKASSIFVSDGKGTGIFLPRGIQPGAILPSLAKPRRAPRSLALPLLDPLRGWGGRPRPVGMPRFLVPGISEPYRDRDHRPPSPDDPVNAARLALRLEALASALDDLPCQARRFARWRARHDAAVAQNRGADAAGAPNGSHDAAGAQNKESHGAGRVRCPWPLRPGRPLGDPGRRPVYEVHEVLNVVHGLAFLALESPDTS